MMKSFFVRKLASIVILSVLIFTILTPNFAQAEAGQFFGIRRNIATIIFCGLGGAVLGISTLSFYGDPQNHIGNITSGLALGIIGGAAYVTTRDANRESMQLDPTSDFKLNRQNPMIARTATPISWAWTF